MRVLAIDTACPTGSIALLSDGEVVSEVLVEAPGGFGPVLFDRIAQVLSSAGWALEDVELFAAGSGPGSFTGVRIGLAAIQGLAHATGKPAVGVSNLAALAACGTRRTRGVIMDARRGEVFAAVYSSELTVLHPEVVTPLEPWLASLGEAPEELITSDDANLWPTPPPIPLVEKRHLAAAIGRVAQAQGIHLKRLSEQAPPDANYVRRSDAELKWRDR